MCLDRLVVATRPSWLSLIQTRMAIEWIRRFYPDVKFIVKTYRSTGDKIVDRPLYSIGVKGIFEREIDLAVIRGEADIAVHSLKDLPSELGTEIEVVCYPPRDSPYDVIVTRGDLIPDASKLPRGAVVGTSSLRRRAFILRARPDLNVKVIRGNVDTRIRKLLDGECDAIVIAECGLRRFEMIGVRFPVRYRRLDVREMPPAPCQGIIAITARRGDSEVIKMLRSISHRETTLEALCERAFLRHVGGGCHVPLGCVARAEGDEISIVAAVSTLDGRRCAFVELRGSASSAEDLGRRAAQELRRRGEDIFEELERATRGGQ